MLLYGIDFVLLAEMMKQGAVFGKVMEIQDLQHLESVVDKAGSSLVVVFFYTRSCGVCKELLRDFEQLCQEVRSLTEDHSSDQHFDITSVFGIVCVSL